ALPIYLRPEDFPSNPALKKEEPRPGPRAADVAPPPKWKHVPPPKRELRIGRNLASWAPVPAARPALVAAGALGVPARAGEGFWTSLPRPFVQGDAGLGFRLGLAAGGGGLLVAAFLVN